MAENYKRWALVLWIITSWPALVGTQETPACLTGTMTDVQDWVTATGELTSYVDVARAIDLSDTNDPTSSLRENLADIGRLESPDVKYLSLARNKLTRVPTIFDNFVHNQDLYLAHTLEYLTLFGNQFIEVSSPGLQYDVTLNATGAEEINTGVIHRGETRSMWSIGFQQVLFKRLKELDLRSCGIRAIDSNVFQNMPTLEALYLGGNSITFLSGVAFAGLAKLIHLDLSRNDLRKGEGPKHLTIDSDATFGGLQNLRSIDFSYTIVNPRSIGTLRSIGKQLERLSLCHSGPFSLESGFFSNTSLRILDLSGNHLILQSKGILSGLENTLSVLYASEVGLSNFAIFDKFQALEILKLNNNEIVDVKRITARTLTNLQALDLRRNRLTNWSTSRFSKMPSLKLLDLSSNTINVINKEMIRDFANVSYLGLSGNPMVCNCHSKEFIELAIRNEIFSHQRFVQSADDTIQKRFNYHTGFSDVNNVITNRRNVTRLKPEDRRIKLKAEGNFVLVDYEKSAYTCLALPEGNKVSFFEMDTCIDFRRDSSDKFRTGKAHLFALLAIPGVLLPLLILGFTFRRNIRYFCVTMRNSALISMVNKNKVIDDETIFNYDVFVSYCNEDRPWVLDQLLSHLENDCSVSLCLHERDFQVGLSILENIVSCMDRSKSIMLVISKQFLMSQWCQFEMHLAQHRLLETRREDLILILLEDIPRRLRPNTLHYLMLTKTYIVWPKNKSDQQFFWKRLKKSVTTQRQKYEDKVSLA